MHAIAEPKAAATGEAESKISSESGSPAGAAAAGGSAAAPAAPAAPAAKTGLSLAQRITAMGNALQGRGADADLVALRAEVARLGGDNQRLVAENAKLTADMATAKADLEAAQAAQTDFEAKVNAKAVRKSVEAAASAGCPVEQLSQIAEGASAEQGPATKAELEAAMKGKPLSETIPMLRAFNERNRRSAAAAN